MSEVPGALQVPEMPGVPRMAPVLGMVEVPEVDGAVEVAAQKDA